MHAYMAIHHDETEKKQLAEPREPKRNNKGKTRERQREDIRGLGQRGTVTRKKEAKAPERRNTRNTKALPSDTLSL